MVRRLRHRMAGRAAAGGVVAGAIALAAGTAWAHYPMLLTERSRVEVGQPVTLELTVGHPYMRDRYPVDRPELFRVFPPERRLQDLTDEVERAGTEELPSWKVSYTPGRPGDYVFSVHGAMFHEPPARQVADFVKLVLHVPDEGGAQIGWGRVLDDPIEIVPLTRPYAIPAGTSFRGQALSHGQPMLEAVVEAECFFPTIDEPLPPLPSYRLGVRTDPNGVFAITLPSPGWWMLAVSSDGGPGEQGTSGFPARRAVLWVEVGGTIWDAPPVGAAGAPRVDPADPTDGRAAAPPGPTHATPEAPDPRDDDRTPRRNAFGPADAPSSWWLLALAGGLAAAAIGVRARSGA